MERAVGVLGLGVLLGLAWAASVNRRAIPWRAVGIGASRRQVLATGS